MSNDLRHDKNCLNCGHEVPERYCSHCGQENTQPHETFGHLVHHFAADVVHYDSKFHTSIQYLLFRPGRLTKEYLAGKRVSYINPIRLYIFVSFIFFFTAFAITKKEEEQAKVKTEQKHKVSPNFVGNVLDSVRHEMKEGGVELQDSIPGTMPHLKVQDGNANIFVDDSMGGLRYATVAAYDSAQQTLTPDKRDSRKNRWITRRGIYLRNKYNNADWGEIVVEMVQHQGPKVMFLLLPLFALLLKGIYNWKRWYYADHAIFSIHVHSFYFLLILVTLLIGRIFNTSAFVGWSFLVGFFYLVAALRNTYQQGWWKSFWKAMLISFVYMICGVFVLTGFVLLALAVIM